MKKYNFKEGLKYSVIGAGLVLVGLFTVDCLTCTQDKINEIEIASSELNEFNKQHISKENKILFFNKDDTETRFKLINEQEKKLSKVADIHNSMIDRLFNNEVLDMNDYVKCNADVNDSEEALIEYLKSEDYPLNLLTGMRFSTMFFVPSEDYLQFYFDNNHNDIYANEIMLSRNNATNADIMHELGHHLDNLNHNFREKSVYAVINQTEDDSEDSIYKAWRHNPEEVYAETFKHLYTREHLSMTANGNIDEKTVINDFNNVKKQYADSKNSIVYAAINDVPIENSNSFYTKNDLKIEVYGENLDTLEFENVDIKDKKISKYGNLEKAVINATTKSYNIAIKSDNTILSVNKLNPALNFFVNSFVYSLIFFILAVVSVATTSVADLVILKMNNNKKK